MEKLNIYKVDPLTGRLVFQEAGYKKQIIGGTSLYAGWTATHNSSITTEVSACDIAGVIKLPYEVRINSVSKNGVDYSCTSGHFGTFYQLQPGDRLYQNHYLWSAKALESVGDVSNWYGLSSGLGYAVAIVKKNQLILQKHAFLPQVPGVEQVTLPKLTIYTLHGDGFIKPVSTVDISEYKSLYDFRGEDALNLVSWFQPYLQEWLDTEDEGGMLHSTYKVQKALDAVRENIAVLEDQFTDKLKLPPIRASNPLWSSAASIMRTLAIATAIHKKQEELIPLLFQRYTGPKPYINTLRLTGVFGGLLYTDPYTQIVKALKRGLRNKTFTDETP